MASSSRQANLGRIGEIVQVAVRHGFGYLLDERRGRGGDEEWVTSRGRHLREMLDELGPTFVKFGQLLSTRPDVMPPDMIAELRQLQDAVTPFGYPEIERVIREELGQPIERLFLEFDPEPLAAASIGQVHRAVLPNGRKVVVKVQRPDAPARIESDLSLMRQLAGFVKERVKALEFIDVGEIVDEFARSIRQELDYRQEARNADAFCRNFAGNKHVVVPRTYWSYTRERVLTLEYLEGVQLRDIELDAWSMDQRRELAYIVAEAWLTMIFRHGFFHGDPHPANILVLAPDTIGLVDFGLCGKLTDADMSKLTALFIDAASENIEALPKRLADLGVVYPREREAELVARKAAAIAANPEIANITKEIQVERGKKVFLTSCFACHMADGKGLPNVFPPLAGSDFLKADKDRAVRVVTKGLSGPITVNGKPFNNLMPPQQFSDEQIADVLTYVLNSWGNDFGTVSVADVKRVHSQN